MTRRYEDTHPWIRFSVDLRAAPPRLWMLLGEARACIEQIANVPLTPSVANELHKLYLTKAVHGTTAIEGNTLTEEQVRAVIESRLELPSSQQSLVQEAKNIAGAFDWIFRHALSPDPLPIDRELVQRLNRMTLRDLEVEEDVVPGAIRKHSVTVARYLGAPAEDCSFLLDRLATWLRSDEFDTAGEGVIGAVIKATIAHLYLAWIHPFGDGNGRTSRLLEYLILVQAGVPTPVAHLLSNHYNLTRRQYLQELDRASRSGGDIVPFLQYALEGMVDGLRYQLKRIRGQQILICWRDFVHEQFSRERMTLAKQRQRDLLLALSEGELPIRARDIGELSPKLAAAYSNKTRKTRTRDLNALRKMGLVKRTSAGWTARTELIFVFLPDRQVFEP